MRVGKASRKKKEPKQSQDAPSRESLQKTAPLFNYIPILILLIVSFAVYFNALSGGFVYDDKQQIVNNPWLRDAGNIPAIFSKSVWSFQSGLSTWNFYRPFMHVVYMINYHVFGLDPSGFHLINILFHCGASVLVFLIIGRFLPEHRVTASSVYLSPPFLAAILFASHPIHTEAVTWIAGLPDVAFAFFYLLSFYLYVLFRDGARRSYLLSILSFSVAIFFKEPAITLPILLIAYDYLWKKFDKGLSVGIMNYVPYLAVSGIYLAARYYALGGFAPLKSYTGLSTDQFIMNVFPLFGEYLVSLLWPFHLNFWHTFHPITTLFEASGMISIAATVIFIALALTAYRKNKILLFGLLLFIVPLLPAFYIKGISGKPYAERYLYLPSVGYVLLLALLLSWVRGRLPHAAKSVSIGFMIVAAIFTVGTISRNNVWKDDFHLWSDTAQKSPDCAIAHNELARAYASQGRLEMAIGELQRTLDLKPDSAEAHVSLGNIYASRGQKDKAIGEFQAALRLKPDSAAAREELAELYASEGRTDKAGSKLQNALRQKQDSPEAHVRLAMAYVSQGKMDKAIAEFKAALQLKPGSAILRVGLGNAYAAKGQTDKAIAEFKTVLQLKPDSAIAHVGLGNAYASKGQMERAIEEFKTALQLKPGDAIGGAIAHVGLGDAYESQGRINMAIAEFKAALRLKPDLKEAQHRLEELISKQRS